MELQITKLSPTASIQFTGGENDPKPTPAETTAKKVDQTAVDALAKQKAEAEAEGKKVENGMRVIALLVGTYVLATRGFVYGLLACLGVSAVGGCAADRVRYREITKDRLNSI